jgi:hypothetical protein
VLTREDALRLEHRAQSTLGFAVYSMNEGEDFGRTFLRNALSGDDFETTIGARQAVAAPDVASIQAHRDGSRRLRRGFNLALGAAVVSELFRAKLRLESLRGGLDVLANGLLMQSPFNRQHLLQQRPDRCKGDLRRPLGLQVRQFRRRVHRQQFAQRAERGLPALLAKTAVPTGTAQGDIPEGGAQAQRVVALDGPRPAAVRTAPAPCQVALQLLMHKRLLELAEYGLGLPEGESDVLHLVTWTIDGVKRHGDSARRGPLDANLNGDSHGADLS